MQRKIDSELTAIRYTSKIMNDQVLMWPKREEALRSQALEAEQTENQMRQVSPFRYCGSIHPPQWYQAYGKKYGECGRMNHISAVCRCPRQAVYILGEHEGGQINMVNTDPIIFKAKRSGIATKLKPAVFTAVWMSHINKTKAVTAIGYHFLY